MAQDTCGFVKVLLTPFPFGYDSGALLFWEGHGNRKIATFSIFFF
jgi:hypothetical protein